MRGNDFLDKMELVDPKFVEEAERAPKRRKTVLVKWGAVAACLAVCFFIGSRFVPEIAPQSESEETEMPETTENFIDETEETTQGKEDVVRNPELPLLSLADRFGDGGGMGDLPYYDISDLVTGNPWREDMEIVTLPVFKNLVYDERGRAPELTDEDLQEMEEVLLAVAERFGISKEDIQVVPCDHMGGLLSEDETLSAYERRYLKVHAGGLVLIVGDDHTVRIQFDRKTALPNAITFPRDANLEDWNAVGECLIEEYEEFLEMKNPEVAITGGWANVNRENDIVTKQIRSLEIYEGEGSIEEQLIHYFFRSVQFYHGYRENHVESIAVHDIDLSEKLGDYPIISLEEARDMLGAGKYIAQSVCKFPGMEAVGKVELVYLNNPVLVEYYMPYYKFYAELSAENHEKPAEQEYYRDRVEKYGLKEYGVYYVPAVEEKYLSDVSVWDGRGQ